MANVVNLYGSSASIPLDELASMSKAQLVQCSTILHSALANANKSKFSLERELTLLRSAEASAPAAERQHICDLEGKVQAMETTVKSAQESVRRVASENGDLKRLLSLCGAGTGKVSDAWAQVESKMSSPARPPQQSQQQQVPSPPRSPDIAPHGGGNTILGSPVGSNGGGGGGGVTVSSFSPSSSSAAVVSGVMSSPVALEQVPSDDQTATARKVSFPNSKTASGTVSKSASGASFDANNGSSCNSSAGAAMDLEELALPSPNAAASARTAEEGARGTSRPARFTATMDAGSNASVAGIYKELQGSRTKTTLLEDEVARLKAELHEHSRLLRLREPVDVQYLQKMNAALTKQTAADRERILELQNEIARQRHEQRRIEMESEATAVELALEAASDVLASEEERAGGGGGSGSGRAMSSYEATAARISELRKERKAAAAGTGASAAESHSLAARRKSNVAAAAQKHPGFGSLRSTSFLDAEVQTDPFMVKLVEICREQADELRDAKLELYSTKEKNTKLTDDMKQLRRECDDLRSDAKKMSALVAEMQSQLKWERTQKAKQQLDAPINSADGVVGGTMGRPTVLANSARATERERRRDQQAAAGTPKRETVSFNPTATVGAGILGTSFLA